MERRVTARITQTLLNLGVTMQLRERYDRFGPVIKGHGTEQREREWSHSLLYTKIEMPDIQWIESQQIT